MRKQSASILLVIIISLPCACNRKKSGDSFRADTNPAENKQSGNDDIRIILKTGKYKQGIENLSLQLVNETDNPILLDIDRQRFHITLYAPSGSSFPMEILPPRSSFKRKPVNIPPLKSVNVNLETVLNVPVGKYRCSIILNKEDGHPVISSSFEIFVEKGNMVKRNDVRLRK